MKKFLKKANRGLLLGGLALFLLIIYIYVDYSGFDEEKTKVKEVVENYIENFYMKMSQNDYEGIYELVDKSWSDEIIITGEDYYYEDKENLSQFFEAHKSKTTKEQYGKVTSDIEMLSVSKIGPDMAKVEVSYSVNMEIGAESKYYSPFTSYSSRLYEDDIHKEYIYKVEYFVNVYLRKVDGEWKIVQCEGEETNSFLDIKESE